MDVLPRHPVLAGFCIGLALALAVAFIASDSELKDGDTRPMIVVIVTAFFAPVCIVTLYVARFASSTRERRALLRVVWPLVGAWFSLWIIWTAISEWNAVRRYAGEGGETTGVVVDSQPQNHNMLVIRYALGGASYQRTVSAPGSARDNVPGEPITIYYYGSRPGEGFCRRPQWQPAATLEGWFLAVGIAPVWLSALAGSLRSERTRQAV